MSIKVKKFVPGPGIVNKQGCLPDPSELVCVEVPKVFDQCLIKRCLVYADGPDTNATDCELRSDPLDNAKRYLGSRDFNIRLCSVDKIPTKGCSSFHKVIISYVISFWADYVDCDCRNKSEFFEINRTDTITRFYCPEPVIQSSARSGGCDCKSVPVPNESNTNIIKVEMVAEALDGELTRDACGNCFLDITLGYYLVVKCELSVQLLIPTYEYCPTPKKPCEEAIEEDICELFERAKVPKFYPDQNLEPLFPECDREDKSEG